jgi:hypothetical protein
MPLTDKLRAAVFARDKGICAFSGLSLWLLDYGTSPIGEPDWPDHIVPVSRGGKDELDNLVCASHFYNRKKLNNGADRSYLFLNGRPTEHFFWTYGELSEAQATILRRHACLSETDWYFNRALFNIRVALGNEADRVEATRDRTYWLRSATKRLKTWRSLSGPVGAASFIRRGLVRYPSAPDVRLMLLLAIADEREIISIYRQLLRHYRANVQALDRFCRAGTNAARRKVLSSASRTAATRPLLAPLRASAERLSCGSIGPLADRSDPVFVAGALARERRSSLSVAPRPVCVPAPRSRR